mgnify:CR=1 FL=1
MASALSLVLAALVTGTVYNLFLLYGVRPYRPIHDFLTHTYAWIVIYGLAAVAGGGALILNRWLVPSLCILLVVIVFPPLVLLFAGSSIGTADGYLNVIKEEAGELAGFALLGFFSAAFTLGFLSLIGG